MARAAAMGSALALVPTWEPNAPPMYGGLSTRTLLAGRPNSLARRPLKGWGLWVVDHTVSFPALVKLATAD